MASAPPVTPAAPLHIIGIGASAGGLQPLSEVLQHCPVGAGLACVVVQHMATHQVSALPQLLASQTPWTVTSATDGQMLEPDHVYVIQPATSVEVVHQHLRVAPLDVGTKTAGTVDRLLLSLARSLGDKAIGVVLSGMGSDGSAGMRAIAQAGGITLAQAPESAQFDSMPRNAAAAGGAQLIVAEPAQVMPRIVAALAERAVAEAAGHRHSPAVLDAILARVAVVTGHDFSLYKSSTLGRRLQRRMSIHGVASASEYLALLDQNPQEAELLFRELLIGVTAWFRDPALWAFLHERVLPTLCAEAAARPDKRLRAWVVGCSTGEEAYTLAMLCREALDADPALHDVAVQVFATDLDAEAVDAARRGAYPASIAEAVAPARLERFFLREGAGWRVRPLLREMVLFAKHDVIVDPPFSRLDLVCCRNLLIYFKPALQQKLLALFHYVLHPGGMLVLGTSETLGRAEADFEPVEPRLRVYRSGLAPRRDAAVLFPIQSPTQARAGRQESVVSEQTPPNTPAIQALAERLMLDEFAPPAVLVDAHGDILFMSGPTSQYIEPPAGRTNVNLHALARPELRAAVVQSLHRAVNDHVAANAHVTFADLPSQTRAVDIAVRPVRGLRPGHVPELFLVVFREAPAAAAAVVGTRRSRRHPLEPQLRAALDEAQALREEMRSSQEELQATNEELQSTNEELQSANEELTSSKEEMQAMNEELQTVNGELVAKLDDLATAQSDLQNLLNSTQIATLFLDARGNVRRFTVPTQQLFSLRDSDVGRPLSDLKTQLDYPTLADDVREVLRTLEFRERATRTVDGRWFSVRIMPYRTQQNVIDGSVITFVDITTAKMLEARLRAPPATPASPTSPTEP